MLETIKQYIEKIEDIPFSEYYAAYIEQVELESIQSEFDYLLSNNSLDVLGMERLLNKSIDELVKSLGK